MSRSLRFGVLSPFLAALRVETHFPALSSMVRDGAVEVLTPLPDHLMMPNAAVARPDERRLALRTVIQFDGDVIIAISPAGFSAATYREHLKRTEQTLRQMERESRWLSRGIQWGRRGVWIGRGGAGAWLGGEAIFAASSINLVPTLAWQEILLTIFPALAPLALPLAAGLILEGGRIQLKRWVASRLRRSSLSI